MSCWCCLVLAILGAGAGLLFAAFVLVMGLAWWASGDDDEHTGF